MGKVKEGVVPNPQESRKPYTTPELTKYGSLAELTGDGWDSRVQTGSGVSTYVEVDFGIRF